MVFERNGAQEHSGNSKNISNNDRQLILAILTDMMYCYWLKGTLKFLLYVPVCMPVGSTTAELALRRVRIIGTLE